MLTAIAKGDIKMAHLSKFGQACIVASVVLFSAGYVCNKIVSDGLLCSLADLFTRASKVLDGV